MMVFGHTKYQESKHKRDSEGKFAHTAGVKHIPGVQHYADKKQAESKEAHDVADQQPKGKQPPKNWKFYKPGYKPKGWDQIKGRNAKSSGSTLYSMKKSGEFANDYEFWLAAQKLATAYKKKHPNGAASPNQIVNAAFRHELEDTGDVKLGVSHAEAPKSEHGATPKGIKVVSKYLAPGQLKPTGKKMAGANGAMVYEDNKGQQWLVKFPGGSKGTSKAYSNSLFLVDLDIATSRIQNKAGLPVPSIHAKDVTAPDGFVKTASVHKMYSRVTDAFPENKVNLHYLEHDEVVEIQKNMVLDWLLSNHDPHSGNFLKTNKGIIGIDKGQSFKYFGKDHLTPNFGSDINPPLAPNVPVYSKLMQQHMKDGYGLVAFDSPDLKPTIDRIMAIDDDEYKDLLRPYAEKAASVGLLNYPSKLSSDSQHSAVHNFLMDAVDRKNHLAEDFDNLWKQLNAKEMGPPKSPSTLEELSPKGMGVESPLADWEQELLDVDNWSGPQPVPKAAPKVKPFQPKPHLDASHPLYGQKPDGAIQLWAEDSASDEDLLSYVEQSEDISLDDIQQWSKDGYIGSAFKQELLDAFNGAVGLPTSKTLPPGYKVVPHPDNNENYAIQKPSGEFSKNPAGVVKSWPTELDANNSSTMTKYKAQSEQQAKAGLAGAQSFAASAPDIKPGDELDLTNSNKYNKIKAKIAAGEGYTADEYLQLKSYVQQIKDQAKASGAAQIEDWHDDAGGFEPPTPSQVAAKKGKLPTPKWKKKGGAPAPLSAAKGPNAISDGLKLYEMKKAGQFNSDDEMWKGATKLSAAYKKKAQLASPGKKLVSGEDYASPNQIRNVAQRLEFDDIGDVIWETSVEKTAGTETQTAKQVKTANVLHAHKPVVNASDAHHVGEHVQAFAGAVDASAPVGSYMNPHSFKLGSTGALQAYGYKYTNHNQGWPSEQKSAWYNFSGSGSGQVNTYFRVGEAGFSFGNIAETKLRCKALVDAFKSPNVKPLEDWTLVTRSTNGGWELGIGSDAVSFEQLKAQEGKVVRNKEPKSSSLRTQPAFSGSVRITYKLPPGFKGLGIYGHSAHASENEMILPPGMAYRILEVKQGMSYKNEVLVEVVDVKLPEIA